jgi:hypothetical protein
MRKWYGQEGFGEGLGEFDDGGGEPEEEEGGAGEEARQKKKQDDGPPQEGPPPTKAFPRTAVAVFGADTPTGEATMTALILAGASGEGVGLAAIGLKRGEAAARELKAAWGDYVRAGTAASSGDAPGLGALLARAAVLILPDAGSVRAGLGAAVEAGVPRVVILVGEGGGGGGGGWLGGLLGGGAASGPAPPASLASASAPITAVLALGGALRDSPGGESALRVSGGAGALPSPFPSSTRPLARGDAASGLAAAALAVAPAGKSCWVSVADAGEGEPPADWAAAVAGALSAK